MKIVIFLAAVSAANSLVGDEGFVPTATVSKYGSKGYQISFGKDPGIERFTAHININRPITVGEVADIEVWGNTKQNDEWIYQDSVVNLTTGDKLNYWTTVQFNGSIHYSPEAITFTMPSAAPNLRSGRPRAPQLRRPTTRRRFAPYPKPKPKL